MPRKKRLTTRDSIRVPLQEKTLKKPPSEVPALIPLGKLVLFESQRAEIGSVAGWVIQNCMSPGGQNDSYLVVPYHLNQFAKDLDEYSEEELDALEEEDPNHAELECPPHGTVCYTPPYRISASTIIAVLDPELP